eukprot:2235283-Amphidinium_carterae.1
MSRSAWAASSTMPKYKSGSVALLMVYTQPLSGWSKWLRGCKSLGLAPIPRAARAGTPKVVQLHNREKKLGKYRKFQ